MNMRFLRHISGTQRLLEELACNAFLWDRYTMRTRDFLNSPHRDAHDIWLRYRDYSEYNPESPRDFGNTPEANYQNWYATSNLLPKIKQTIENIMAFERITEFGACLITKIPPGKVVFPHSDNDWHATYYKDKYLLLLEADDDQAFCYNGESYSGKPGDLYHFNNNVEHWVDNDSDLDRISLIIAGRKDGN